MKRRSNVLSFTPVPSTSAKRLFLYFRGKLEDGTVFDSSHKRNKPFSFTLGVGQVIQGWDDGVIQMKVGEKALLQITSDYGYGSRGKWEVGSSSLSALVVFLQYFLSPNVSGAGGVIPPNADLDFEVEFLAIM
jgi:FKBP-type peptidyl-prolyl cis-trans isomerase